MLVVDTLGMVERIECLFEGAEPALRIPAFFPGPSTDFVHRSCGVGVVRERLRDRDCRVGKGQGGEGFIIRDAGGMIRQSPNDTARAEPSLGEKIRPRSLAGRSEERL